MPIGKTGRRPLPHRHCSLRMCVSFFSWCTGRAQQEIFSDQFNGKSYLWRTLSLVIFFSICTLAEAGQLEWIKQTRFFAYTPSGFHFEHDQPIFASRDSIAQDLPLLRRYADGLILYATDNSTADILAVAHDLKFKAVILGIWSVSDRNEIQRGIDLARHYPKLVRAISVGNEGLFWRWYTKSQLVYAIDIIRTALPNLALATTEPFASYLGEPAKIDCEQQDFLLPTVHPVFEQWFSPAASAQSVEFIENVVTRLIQLCQKPVLIKETGVPSGPQGQGYSEQAQRLFWQTLLTKMKAHSQVSVAFFEAFDAPWKMAEMQKTTGKRDEREQYWGWFTHDRKAKKVVQLLTVHQ